MVTVYSDQMVRSDLTAEDYVYSLENQILEDIVTNRSFRMDATKVSVDLPTNAPYDSLDVFVSSRVPANFGYLLRVCNLGDPDDMCKLPSLVFMATMDKDVFVKEAVISAEMDESGAVYDPKLVRLFFWEGGWPDGVCRDECDINVDVTLCKNEDLTKVFRKVCGNFDADECKEYSPDMEKEVSCDAGEFCVDGACVESEVPTGDCKKVECVKFTSNIDKFDDECDGFGDACMLSDGCERGSDCSWVMAYFSDYEDIVWSDCMTDEDYSSLDYLGKYAVCPDGLMVRPDATNIRTMPCECEAPVVDDCVDTTWNPATNTICKGVAFEQTSNCDNTRTATGTKASVWTPTFTAKNYYKCVSQRQTDTTGCKVPRTVWGEIPCDGTCNAATNTCTPLKANLVATLTRTTTVKTYDSSAGCYYNKCNYDVVVSNTGTASGTVWKRVVSGAASVEEIYNQVVGIGKTVELGEEWIKSGCSADLSYGVNIYDDKGKSIGGTTFICSHP